MFASKIAPIFHPRIIALDAHTSEEYRNSIIETQREIRVIDTNICECKDTCDDTCIDYIKIQLTKDIFENCDIWLKTKSLFYPAIIYFEEDLTYVIDYYLVEIIN